MDCFRSGKLNVSIIVHHLLCKYRVDVFTRTFKIEISVIVFSKVIVIDIYDSAQLMKYNKVNYIKDDDAHVYSSNTCRPRLDIPCQFLLATICILVACYHVSTFYRHWLAIGDIILNSI